MNPYSIPPFLSAFLFFSLAVLVYKRNLDISASRGYVYFCVPTVFWQGTWAILFNVKDPAFASLLVKIGYSFIIFIPITFYHFNMNFMQLWVKEKIRIQCLYIIGVLFLISLWSSSWFIDGYYRFYWGYYPKAGYPLHPVFLMFLTFLAFRPLQMIYWRIQDKNTPPLKRYQLIYLMTASIAYSFASSDFVVNYGIEYYPLGVVALLISLALIAYAVIRYRLMDLRFLVQESSRYLLSAAILSVLVAVFFYFVTKSLNVSMSVFIIGLIIPYIHTVFMRWLFTLRIKSGLVGNSSKRRISSFADRIKESGYKISDLAQTVAEITADEVPCSMSAMYVLDHDKGVYYLESQVGLRNKLPPSVSMMDPITVHLEQNKQVFVKTEAERYLSSNDFEIIDKNFSAMEAEVCVPLVVLDRVGGVLVLGPKKDRHPYFVNEINRLVEIATEAATALRYVMAVSGAASETKRWAHSLNQSLKPLAQGFDVLADMDPSISTNPNRAEIYNRMKRPLKRLSDFLYYLTHQARIIDENLRNKYELIPIDIGEIIRKSISTYKISADRKGVQFNVNIDSNGVNLRGHMRDLVSVFEALLSNAVRYVNEHGTISIKGVVDGDVYKIEVENTGPSINPLHFEDIFIEGYQIKDGKEGTGGLGLANAKRIVQMHQGRIWAENVGNMQGVRFIIELPLFTPVH
ncbi:MAG: hypothetical protein LHV69_04320 [Elusimicrobia bacterium]|nr:hypothetical protein [Candidatus Obscuribacterium magneticum]